MNTFDHVFTDAEKITFALRALYSDMGYRKYQMSKFEEYDLYLENKNFLQDSHVITFNDTDGRLLALKPDVTLSIAKNTSAEASEKLYYTENVYRASRSTHEYKEIMQVGLEYIGRVDLSILCEVLTLAAKSLDIVGKSHTLSISHMGFVTGLLEEAALRAGLKERIISCINNKNAHEIAAVCEKEGIAPKLGDKLAMLSSLYGSFEEILPKAKALVSNDKMGEALAQLGGIYNELKAAGECESMRLDFSVTNDMSYYNGLVFQGFTENVPFSVLSGGRYDHLMHKLGKKTSAIGFAVYLDHLPSGGEAKESGGADEMINIALPKGRLGEKAYDALESIGCGCPAIRENNRKLIFENAEAGVRYFWVKPSDVAIYVEHGAADIGIVGLDIILEQQPDVYELLKLGIGKCRVAVAAVKGFRENPEKALRVATKFPGIAKKYYAKTGRDIEIIKLNGSIELAPILKMSDVIVDIVETGKTLYENNLEVTADIVDISARFIANKASFKFKNRKISQILEKLKNEQERTPK